MAEEWSITHDDGNAPDGEDGVLVAARHVTGGQPLEMTVHSHIPIGKGLGSSAAAYVAGVAAALRAIEGEAKPARVYRLASDLEGHPEQVAAAVYGGLVLVPAEGMPIRLPMNPRLRPVIGVPATVLATSEARLAVQQTLPIDVTVRSLARVAALVAGLVTGDPSVLGAAHGDEIHEAPRAALSPEVGELIEVARSAGAIHAARSGAGPAVVAIATAETAPRVAAAFASIGVETIDQPIDTTGLI
jgi:homoserine kinase